MPPPSPRRSTSTRETQTTPPQNNIQDQTVLGPTRLQSPVMRIHWPTIQVPTLVKERRHKKKSIHEVPL